MPVICIVTVVRMSNIIRTTFFKIVVDIVIS